jgi:hypothetical protein
VSSRRQLYRTIRSCEELELQRVFQQLYLPAERRLRDVQPLGCPAEVKLIGNDKEILQLFQFKH